MPSERLLDHGPFYALQVAASAARAFGGVGVDLHGRVPDTDGAVIPGVYAAGELTGMLGGWLTAVVIDGRDGAEKASCTEGRTPFSRLSSSAGGLTRQS